MKPNRNTWFEQIFLTGWSPYIWLGILIALVFGRSLAFGFTYLDDNTLILNNLPFLQNFRNFTAAFRDDVFRLPVDSYYRPLQTVFLMLGAGLGGAGAVSYHAISLLLHALVVGTVFRFLTALGYPKNRSFLAAVAFSILPVVTQAVVWIPGQVDLLLTLFLLLAFQFGLKFWENGKPVDYAGHLIFLAGAFLTKETALMLLPLFGAYLFLFKDWRHLRRWLTFGGGWTMVVLGWFLLRRAAFSKPLKLPLMELLGFALKDSPATLQLLGKAVFPVNLSVLPTIKDTTFVWGALAVTLIGALIWKTGKKRWRRLAFGSLWFALFLFPALIRTSGDFMPDFIEHRLYLPLIGLLLVVLETDIFAWPGRRRSVAIILTTILFLVWGVTSFWHSGNFRDPITFWENAAKFSPSHPLAHRNLGAMYVLVGRFDEAETAFRRALSLNKAEPMAHNNLGLIYANRGQVKEAEAEYQLEIAINPNYAAVYYNLGLLYLDEGRESAAVPLWQKSLALDPNFADGYRVLAAYYQSKGELDLAEQYLAELKRRGLSLTGSR